jgi:hypothetical protein
LSAPMPPAPRMPSSTAERVGSPAVAGRAAAGALEE